MRIREVEIVTNHQVTDQLVFSVPIQKFGDSFIFLDIRFPFESSNSELKVISLIIFNN